MLRVFIIAIISLFSSLTAGAQGICFVELNCENLFDIKHDTLKNDIEFTPEGARHWTKSRYWNKLTSISKEIISCGGEGESWQLPDFVALIEVENDSVMRDLTKRSLLRKANYEYAVTCSDDLRGIDVALLYNPLSFRFLSQESIKTGIHKKEKPTRDILHVKGLIFNPNDTTSHLLHVFVVHAPSRSGGKGKTDSYRCKVAERLCQCIDSIRIADNNEPYIIVAGDFNDYYTDASVMMLSQHGMTNVSAGVKGHNGAEGTYRYKGEWGSLDQILVSNEMLNKWAVDNCYINDALFLLEDDKQYGGKKPRRTFVGPRYDKDGYSDHLPLVLNLK